MTRLLKEVKHYKWPKKNAEEMDIKILNINIYIHGKMTC